MARSALTTRDLATASIYVSLVVVLIGGAFFAVQGLLPSSNKAAAPEISAPFKKIQAGAPRELPPIEEGKPERSVYAPSIIRRPEINREDERERVPALPRAPERPESLNEAENAPPPPRLRFVPPDVHDR